VESVDIDAVELGAYLDAGGYAEVYEGTYRRDGEQIPVAVKRPLRRDGRTMERGEVRNLLDEGERWDRVDDHPNIVDLLGTGRREGDPWLVMEYTDGGTLAERVGEVDIREGLWILERLADALLHVHYDQGTTHLDLTPSNVLFRSVERGWDVPKIADWGLARESADLSISVHGLTVEYAAPEQRPLTDDPLSPRTDLYQLGIICYELFAGSPPFTSESEVLSYHRGNEPFPELTAVDAGIQTQLDDTIRQLVALDPDDRYKTPERVLKDIRSIHQRIVEQKPQR
jgi:serine/threonine protein kinase